MNLPPKRLEIGIDDTDSLNGGCTTFVAYNIIKTVTDKHHVKVADYPYLIRLNPNYPPKTKGNGAIKVSLQLDVDADLETVTETITDVVRSHSRIDEEGTEPAIALATDLVRDESLADFYHSTLINVLRPRVAVELAERHGIDLLFLKDSDKGAVGALAALGADLSGDHTYELLAYRDEDMWGKPRQVDKRSVITMDHETSPLTFNNYDYTHKRVLIAPRGPDPVLVGIRGETPDVLLRALEMLRFHEPIFGYAVFKTNQGTDAHFRTFHERHSEELVSHSVRCVSGKVIRRPEAIRGGHVLFSVGGEAQEVPVICFAESGELTKKVRKLERDDFVEVCGGTRERGKVLCLNLERLDLVQVVAKKIIRPPVCPDCGKRCKSKGLRQGYACPKCGRAFRQPQTVEVERAIEPGTYLPDAGAMRHLSKPLSRKGLEKGSHQAMPLVDGWFK